MSLLKVGIRYCGGCNPTFERVEAVETLFRSLEGKARAVGYREEGIQALLVVCGCPTACPAQDEIPLGLPAFVLHSQHQIQEAFSWIMGLLDA